MATQRMEQAEGGIYANTQPANTHEKTEIGVLGGGLSIYIYTDKAT